MKIAIVTKHFEVINSWVAIRKKFNLMLLRTDAWTEVNLSIPGRPYSFGPRAKE